MEGGEGTYPWNTPAARTPVHYALLPSPDRVVDHCRMEASRHSTVSQASVDCCCYCGFQSRQGGPTRALCASWIMRSAWGVQQDCQNVGDDKIGHCLK